VTRRADGVFGLIQRYFETVFETMSETAKTDALDLTERDDVCALAPVVYAPVRHHVFVCNGKSCVAVGSPEVKEAFRRELIARSMLFSKPAKGGHLKGSVVLTDCGSVGFCAVGAAVLVYPDGVWYSQVRAEDVHEIVEEHIVNGRTVERLALFKVPAESPAKTETAMTAVAEVHGVASVEVDVAKQPTRG